MQPKNIVSWLWRVLLFVWELSLAFALSKGMLIDLVPTQVVAAGLVAPPFAILCYSLRGLVIRLNKAVSLLIYLLIGLAAGFVAWGIVMVSPKPAPAVTSHTDERIADLTKEVHQLQEKIPFVDDAAKLSALQNRASELSKEKDKFTNREKEILSQQTLNLQSLEEARKQHIGKMEVERQQQELAQRQKEIERQKLEKAAHEANELREKNFANQYTPIIEYAITSLYRQLNDISRQSSEPLVSNFPGDHPSIHGSAMLKDGKFADGEHFIRVGSRKGWEFHVIMSGPNPSSGMAMKRYLGFRIQAGTSTVAITNEYPRMDPPPPGLQIFCRAGDKELYSEKCSLSEYQKPIDQAITELIKDRYYESPLQRKR